MGTKSFVLCCYENEPYTPLLFGTRFNKVKGFFFFLSVSRCGIHKREAHVRGVTRWEAVILNYKVVFGACFPFDIIGEIPALPREKLRAIMQRNYERKLLPTRIQNWTRYFCALFAKLNVDNQYMPNTSYL